MNDMMQAWYDLALAPFTAMAKSMTGVEPASAKVAAEKPPAAKAG
jgi:hypothetical protein